MSQMNKIQDLVNISVMCYIGKIILNALKWATMPQSPYYMRMRIKYLENELIKKTLEVNEEVIRP